MGVKGNKLTNAAQQFCDDLIPRLQPLGDVSSRKMFGGFGIFHDKKMFGIVDSRAGLFFKVDDSNAERYQRAGSAKHGKMPYFEVPESVQTNDEDVREWARASIEAARK